jgi:hypothetical protein
VVERNGSELRFRPGDAVADRRGNRWDVDGDPVALEAEVRDGVFEGAAYPNALERLWTALVAPHAGDVSISLAEGYECVDWGGGSHVGGGSHGALAAGDSLSPLLTVGVEPAPGPRPEQWTLRDVRALILNHFGVAVAPSEPVAAG